MVLAGICRGTSLPALPSDPYLRSIREFGGSVVNPMAYPGSAAGFQHYLKDSGVTAISGNALILPNHPEVAERLGFHDFLPP